MKEEREGMRDLRVRTKAFAVRVVKMVGVLPRSMPGQVMGKQVLRSATSVGANYREAQRARSKAEFVAIVGLCCKELDETAYWLELLAECDVLPAQRLAALHDECDQLIAIFTTILKKGRSMKAEG